jgi:hypothetical protein
MLTWEGTFLSHPNPRLPLISPIDWPRPDRNSWLCGFSIPRSFPFESPPPNLRISFSPSDRLRRSFVMLQAVPIVRVHEIVHCDIKPDEYAVESHCGIVNLNELLLVRCELPIGTTNRFDFVRTNSERLVRPTSISRSIFIFAGMLH